MTGIGYASHWGDLTLTYRHLSYDQSGDRYPPVQSVTQVIEGNANAQYAFRRQALELYRQVVAFPVKDEFLGFDRGDVVSDVACTLRKTKQFPRPLGEFELGRVAGTGTKGFGTE